MHKRLVISISIAISILVLALNFNFLYKRVTGFANLGVDVSLQEKLDGKLFLSYEPSLELGGNQEIYVEFINIGSVPVTEKIEIKVYGYIDGTIEPIAYYYDSTVSLNPGMRRSYSTFFVPPSAGGYYIQAKSTYNTKVVEVWGAFYVYYPPYVIPPAPVSPVPAVPAPELNLTYLEKVTILKGGSIIVPVTVKNIGGANAYNLRFYVSTSNLINFDVNPKQVSNLLPTQSTAFLVLIDIPSNVSDGKYPFDFEVISDKKRERGSIEIEVVSELVSEEEAIYQKILNYEFLIAEIEHEISLAASNGIDVSLANQSLNNAKANLETARDFFNLRKFVDAKDALKNVEKNLSDAVFQLANANLYIYRPSAFAPFWILIIILLMAAAASGYYYYKKRKRRKPRLLRNIGEGETEK